MFSNPFCQENFLRYERHVPGCASSTRLNRKNLTRSEINKRTKLSQSLIELSPNGTPRGAEIFRGGYSLPGRIALTLFVVGFFNCRERLGRLNFPIFIGYGRNGFCAFKIIDKQFCYFFARLIHNRQSLIDRVTSASGIAIIIDGDAQFLVRGEPRAAKREIANSLTDRLSKVDHVGNTFRGIRVVSRQAQILSLWHGPSREKACRMLEGIF